MNVLKVNYYASLGNFVDFIIETLHLVFKVHDGYLRNLTSFLFKAKSTL